MQVKTSFAKKSYETSRDRSSYVTQTQIGLNNTARRTTARHSNQSKKKKMVQHIPACRTARFGEAVRGGRGEIWRKKRRLSFTFSLNYIYFFFFLNPATGTTSFPCSHREIESNKGDREKERRSFCEISENNPHGLSTSLQKTKTKITPITRELGITKHLNKKSFNLAYFFLLIIS